MITVAHAYPTSLDRSGVTLAPRIVTPSLGWRRVDDDNVMEGSGVMGNGRGRAWAR